jgi:hypothetical protein
MTILDRLTPKRRGPVPLVPDPPKAPVIAVKIDAIQTDLAGVDEQIGQAALKVEFELDGASDELADLKKRRAGLEARLADLTAAHAAALEVDRAALARSRTAAYKHAVKKVEKQLAERDKQAARAVAAMTEMIAATQEMWRAGRRAQRAMPNGAGEWPDYFLGTSTKFGRALAVELYRLGGTHALDKIDDGHAPPFAGLKHPLGPFGGSPIAQPVFLDAVAASTRYILDVLEGKAVQPPADFRIDDVPAEETDILQRDHEEATLRAMGVVVAETDPEHS